MQVQFNGAVTVLPEELERALRISSPGHARAVGIQGDLLMGLVQGQAALECFQRQFQWGQALGDAEMQGLAHNDIGVLLIRDDPGGALERYQMAYDVFHAAGGDHLAGLGLSAFNLSVAYGELGDTGRSDALLAHALEVLGQTRARWTRPGSFR